MSGPLQRKHLQVSSWLSHVSTGRCFLALTAPKARETCGGGRRTGSKSTLYSRLSQRAVSGNLLQGATRSMLETTRQWNCRPDSFLARRQTWARRREECGFCHAHSNWRDTRKPFHQWLQIGMAFFFSPWFAYVDEIQACNEEYKRQSRPIGQFHRTI